MHDSDLGRLNIYEEQRPWGSFRQFTKNCPSTVKILNIKPGEALSRQSHEKRSEFWRVIDGSGTIEINGKAEDSVIGDEYEVPQGASHRISCDIDSASPLRILEISFGHFEEGDIVRSEDKYGRI